MAASAPSLLKRTFDSPDETRPAGSGKAAIVDLAQATFMRVTVPPGWRWSKDVKPIAGTDSCQAAHLGYVLSGRMRSAHRLGHRGSPAVTASWEAGHDGLVAYVAFVAVRTREEAG
jgi:hypothetical protein